MNTDHYLGQKIKVNIDRPIGTSHPRFAELVYTVNYGYVPFTSSQDGEEIDVYVLGIDFPLISFEGICVAIIRRFEEDDDKLIVIPDNTQIDDEEIIRQTYFQEKYFKIVIIRDSERL